MLPSLWCLFVTPRILGVSEVPQLLAQQAADIVCTALGTAEPHGKQLLADGGHASLPPSLLQLLLRTSDCKYNTMVISQHLLYHQNDDTTARSALIPSRDIERTLIQTSVFRRYKQICINKQKTYIYI